MNVDATITTKEIRKVEINPTVILLQMRLQWISSLQLPWPQYLFAMNSPNSTYINDKGIWEYWENGHGSGFTSQSREATVEERVIYNSFKTILALECLS